MVYVPAKLAGAVATGTPGAFSLGDDHVQLVFIGTDRQAWSAWWSEQSGEWSLNPLGGEFRPGDGIAALRRKPGLVELFARGMDNAIYFLWRRGPGNQSGWQRLDRVVP